MEDVAVKKSPGVIHNTTTIILNTKQATNLFYGRKKTKDQSLIFGLNDFAKRVKYINNAAHHDDPYADYFLLEIEKVLIEAKELLEKQTTELTALSDKSLLIINQGSSVHPLKIETNYSATMANIALEILKMADNVILTIYALRHTGLLTRVDSNNKVNQIVRLMRKTFLAQNGYKYFDIKRKDAEHKTARWFKAHTAMKFNEDLPEDILKGERRAEHAPNIILDPNIFFRRKVDTKKITTKSEESTTTQEKKNDNEN